MEVDGTNLTFQPFDFSVSPFWVFFFAMAPKGEPFNCGSFMQVSTSMVWKHFCWKNTMSLHASIPNPEMPRVETSLTSAGRFLARFSGTQCGRLTLMERRDPPQGSGKIRTPRNLVMVRRLRGNPKTGAWRNWGSNPPLTNSFKNLVYQRLHHYSLPVWLQSSICGSLT